MLLVKPGADTRRVPESGCVCLPTSWRVLQSRTCHPCCSNHGRRVPHQKPVDLLPVENWIVSWNKINGSFITYLGNRQYAQAVQRSGRKNSHRTFSILMNIRYGNISISAARSARTKNCPAYREQCEERGKTSEATCCVCLDRAVWRSLMFAPCAVSTRALGFLR